MTSYWGLLTLYSKWYQFPDTSQKLKNLTGPTNSTIKYRNTYYITHKEIHVTHSALKSSTWDTPSSISSIPRDWIIPNSQSTLDVFLNARLLTNVCNVKIVLVLYCNAKRVIVIKKGDLKGYVTVWLYSEGIWNILSLKQCPEEAQGDVWQYC